jgi:hypothetical protein
VDAFPGLIMVLTSAPQLGWGFRSIGRGLKKVGKGAVKVSIKSVTAPVAIAKKIPVVGSVVKLAEKLALLPLKYLIKAVRAIGKTLCAAPPQVLQLACAQANVDPAFIPLFCTAVRENKFDFGSVKRMLPPALKIASKMAASGAFPPIVPALSIVKHIPYVGRFVGSEGDVNVDSAGVTAVRRAMDVLQIVALADYCGALDDADAAAIGLDAQMRTELQGFLAGQVELCEASDRNAMILGGVTAGAAILGFWLLFR